MARRRAATANETDEKRTARKRKRRTDEELIADLQAKIREVKDRAQAKSLKESPTMKAVISAVRAIDKAIDQATEAQDTVLRHTLADAREPLEEHLTRNGMKLAPTRRPKGPRPKAE